MYLLYDCRIKSQQIISGNQTPTQCITVEVVQQKSICICPVLNNKQGSNEGGRRQKYLFDIDYPKLAAATPVSEQSSSLATKIKFVK